MRRLALALTAISALTPQVALAQMDHPSDEGVVKAAPSLKGGSQNEKPHPRFHQRPDRVPKEGVEFSGDWSAWSGCVSTTNATGLMLCLALPPW